jgi:hypothetical protein
MLKNNPTAAGTAKSKAAARENKDCGQDRQVEIKQLVSGCYPINRDHQREIAQKWR